MCGFLEKLTRQTERERETDRDETVFNGPNCPVGVGPKNILLKKFFVKKYHFLFALSTPKKPEKAKNELTHNKN